MDPWTPELEVTPDLAQTLITKLFPELKVLSLTRLDSGWDNVVYRVEAERQARNEANKQFGLSSNQETLLFRFPQREQAVAGVELEMAALKSLDQIISCVPKMKAVGSKSDSYPWPFFGYEPVRGLEACDSAMSRHDRSQLAKPLAEVLKKLHSESSHDLINVELPRDPLGRLDFTKRVPLTEDRLEKLEHSKVELPYNELRKVLRAALDIPKLPTDSVVHGDLHFRHIIVSEQNTLAGLIDWGDIHLNDPAADLQIYWSFFEPPARAKFKENYGPISEQQLLIARAFSVFMNVALLSYALSQSRDSVAAEATWALSNLLKG